MSTISSCGAARPPRVLLNATRKLLALLGAYPTGGASLRDGPSTTSNAASINSTVRAIRPGPDNSEECGESKRPFEGLNPTSPCIAAGMRTLPPASVPTAKSAMPAATVDAAPPLLPPLVRVRSMAERVTPNRSELVVAFQPNSGIVVRPTITQPALRRLATTGASAWSILCGQSLEP